MIKIVNKLISLRIKGVKLRKTISKVSQISLNSEAANFIEIALQHVCSPVNLLHIFRTPFTKNTSGGGLLLWIERLWEKIGFRSQQKYCYHVLCCLRASVYNHGDIMYYICMLGTGQFPPGKSPPPKDNCSPDNFHQKNFPR